MTRITDFFRRVYIFNVSTGFGSPRKWDTTCLQRLGYIPKYYCFKDESDIKLSNLVIT